MGWSSFAFPTLILVALLGLTACSTTTAAPPSTTTSTVVPAPPPTTTPTLSAIPAPTTTSDTAEPPAQTSYDMTIDLITSSTWEAQTFTVPGHGYLITGASVNIIKVGSPPEALTISIRATDKDGHPTGSDLTSGMISPSAISESDGFIDVTFSSTYALNANTEYALVMYSTGESSTDYYSWWIQRSDVFAGGNLEQSVDSGTTWTSQPWDASFRLYVTSGS